MAELDDVSEIQFPLKIRFRDEDKETGFNILFSCGIVYSEGNCVWKIYNRQYRKLKEAGIDFTVV